MESIIAMRLKIKSYFVEFVLASSEDYSGNLLNRVMSNEATRWQEKYNNASPPPPPPASLEAYTLLYLLCISMAEAKFFMFCFIYPVIL